MKIRILSDLHREFGPTEIPSRESDLIILAGDISTKENGLGWIREFSGKIPTAYVCGNHEYYGDKLPRITQKLREATAGSNIHLLEDDSFMVGGWNIYGCSLWTDLALQGDWEIGAEFARDCMNDYKRIRNSARGFRKLSPHDTREIHLLSLARLDRFLLGHDPRKTIVVTHHAPSALSLTEDRRNKTLSCAYATHLDEFILRHQPHLWIHGHIHHSNDYLIGETRVISNPQGYPEEPNPSFNPELILEV